jgi:hypothetical protein
MKNSSEMMAFGGSKMERTQEMLPMGMKRIFHNPNNSDDSMKLESRILKRTNQDLRETPP